jgi:hypothetical protein
MVPAAGTVVTVTSAEAFQSARIMTTVESADVVTLTVTPEPTFVTGVPSPELPENAHAASPRAPDAPFVDVSAVLPLPAAVADHP